MPPSASCRCSCSSLISVTSSASSSRSTLLGLGAQLLEERLGPVAEAARDQLRRSRQAAAVLCGERRHDDQHAVLGEPPPVAQRDVVHVADAEPVDERHSGLDVVDDPRDPVPRARRRCRSRRARSCPRARRSRARAGRARRACGTRRAPASPPSAAAARGSCAAPRRGRGRTRARARCPRAAPRRPSSRAG